MKVTNLELNITKIANVILYMLENKVSHLNDKKLSILLFLMDYKHMEIYENKIFGEIYIKDNRSPEPQVLAELFDIIANSEDLEEDDERLYLIQEFLDHLDIDVVTKANYIELKFVKMEDDFDESLFTKEELKTINKAIERYKNETPRKMANVCFTIDKVRETKNGEIII
jgi:hypothetical protein